jgi:hypothetical protein
MRAVKRSHSQQSLSSFAPAIEQFVQGALGVQLTPAATLGLLYCHERLIIGIGCELASQTDSKDAMELQNFSTDASRSRVQVLPRHVKEAFACLGLDSLWIAASESVQMDDRTQKSSGKAVRPNKRRKEWTKDQEAEQNRLLELSKEKLFGRP